jgi:hypothetical protein
LPPKCAHASFRQQRNANVTEFLEMKNRGHALVIDSGWREVADASFAFLKRFIN